MKYYTGAGDDGTTENLRGLKVPKDSIEINLIGTMDELTSVLGLAKSTALDGELRDHIDWLQQDILKFNADLSMGEELTLSVEFLESVIDSYQQYTGSFQGFVKPGDSRLGAVLDIARTVARRSERIATQAIRQNLIANEFGIYLNRLSDLLYAMARFAGAMEKVRKQIHGSIEESLTGNLEGSDYITAAHSINLHTAQKLSKKIQEYAQTSSTKAVIAVCDSGGNLLLLHKMDDAFIASIDIAINKAFTSAALKMTTEKVGELSKPGSSLYGLELTNNGRIVIFGGGVPLKMGHLIIGGLGVSGGTAEIDTELAEYGARLIERKEV